MAVTTTPADRVASLKAAKDERKNAEKMHDAGFDYQSDYDAWLILEELRKLTLDARKAEKDAEAKAKAAAAAPLASGGYVSFNPGSQIYNWSIGRSSSTNPYSIS